MYEWSDLRIFLAVVREGSALGAAKTLGINQTTVNRRVQALEHALGLTLFDRRNRGHSLTEHGKALLEPAKRVAKAANDLSSAAERLRRNISGVVRITAPEDTSSRLIIPIAADFRRQFPDVRIEQVVADRRLDIVHGEADIAIRNGSGPDDDRLVARRLPGFAWSLYCSKDYAQAHGMPASRDEVTGHDFVAYSEGPVNWSGYRWFVAAVDPTRIVSQSNTIPNMAAVLRSGIGVGLLPCFIGNDEPMLKRCFDAPRELYAESWLLTSPEALSSPQVRAFVDFLVPRLMAQRNLLTGNG